MQHFCISCRYRKSRDRCGRFFPGVNRHVTSTSSGSSSGSRSCKSRAGGRDGGGGAIQLSISRIRFSRSRRSLWAFSLHFSNSGNDAPVSIAKATRRSRTIALSSRSKSSRAGSMASDAKLSRPAREKARHDDLIVFVSRSLLFVEIQRSRNNSQATVVFQHWGRVEPKFPC